MSLIKKIIERVYPVWKESHYIHIPRGSYSSNIINIKKEFEDENFIKNQKKYSDRELIYVLLTTLKSNLSKDIHEMIDELYNLEKINSFNIENTVNKKFVIWKGDITHLKVDGIVNAANSYLEGCFIPFHRCIDNVIHEKSGPHLREECRSWKCKFESIGKCRISKGYHLPSKYVLHTVGPIYDKDKDQSKNLQSSYNESLNIGKQNKLKSLAFCCISTGEFRYPNKEAAEIACKTVKEWIDENNHYECIVFNVYKEDDYKIYQSIAPSIFGENNVQIL